jgi:hypothetical protein
VKFALDQSGTRSATIPNSAAEAHGWPFTSDNARIKT